MFLCVFLDSIEYTNCGDSHVSLSLKHQMIICFHTLPLACIHALIAHFCIWCTHTHTLWHDECVMPWLNHGLMFSIFTCRLFWITLSIPIFRFLIRCLCFGTNLLLIKFVTGYCAMFCGICCFVLQMAPWKITTQCDDKRKRMDDSRFRSTQHFEWYNHHFEKAPII